MFSTNFFSFYFKLCTVIDVFIISSRRLSFVDCCVFAGGSRNLPISIFSLIYFACLQLSCTRISSWIVDEICIQWIVKLSVAYTHFVSIKDLAFDFEFKNKMMQRNFLLFFPSFVLVNVKSQNKRTENVNMKWRQKEKKNKSQWIYWHFEHFENGKKSLGLFQLAFFGVKMAAINSSQF